MVTSTITGLPQHDSTKATKHGVHRPKGTFVLNLVMYTVYSEIQPCFHVPHSPARLQGYLFWLTREQRPSQSVPPWT